jgi:hypothetical protein
MKPATVRATPSGTFTAGRAPRRTGRITPASTGKEVSARYCCTDGHRSRPGTDTWPIRELAAPPRLWCVNEWLVI